MFSTYAFQRITAAVLLCGMLAASALGVTIQDIRIEPLGTVPVVPEQVLAQISLRPGDELDRAILSEDIKSIQKAGAFSYAEARVEPVPGSRSAENVVLVLRVSARAKINRLTIDGSEYFGNPKIRNLLDIRSGDLVDDTVLGLKSQAVTESYRKEYFPHPKLTWTFQPVEGRPEYTDVAIHVEEGRRAVVRNILLPGAKHVSRSTLLDAMTQRRHNPFLSWMTGTGTYSPSIALSDVDVLRKVFMNKGYLAAVVETPKFQYVTDKKLDLTYAIQEGPLYHIGEWRISGATLFDAAQLERGVVAKSGQVASLEAIETSARNIRDFYGSRGYIRTVVEPLISLDFEKAKANVTYRIREGRLATIRNVEIRGNSRTHDKVIRREISVLPGDIYNEVRVRHSENRIRNLNYFSYVNSYPETTTVSNAFDLIFDVEEQNTGQFQLGVAFSSVDNILGYVELTQGNFDLFGMLKHRSFVGAGQKLRLRAQLGDSRNDLELSFIEPWFLNRRLSFGFDLFRHANSYSDEYDQTSTGGRVSLGHPLGAFNRGTLSYELKNVEIDELGSDATRWIREEEGSRLQSAMTLKLDRNTTDHTFLPTRGFRGSISGTLAGGPLGADTDFYAAELRAAQFFPLPMGSVLSFRGFTSVVEEYGDSERVPIFNRVFMGGPRTVRAFKFREVGPKDLTEEPVGGRSGAFGSVELTVPIVKYIRAALFYDVGVVWQDVFKKDKTEPETAEDVIIGDGKVCSGYGIGIRLDIPQLPIQLDYAWPIDSDEMNDTGGRFSFSLGYTY